MSKYVPKGLGRHLLRHPKDLSPLVSVAWVMRRRGWWRHSPFLPLPDEQYWQFRLLTAYGSVSVEPTIEDVLAAARWSRDVRHRQ